MTPSRSAPEGRRPRVDGQRNRALLLAAAQDVFGRLGPDAPFDEVARQAGVGNATLYRHFPTRGDLIVAVYAEEVAELCRYGDELGGAPDPAAALFDWLRAFVSHVADKRGLALAIADDHEGTRSTLYDEWHRAMLRTASALLERAQKAGAVRAGIDPADLLVLANGIALSRPDADQAGRLLGVLRHGVAAAAE